MSLAVIWLIAAGVLLIDSPSRLAVTTMVASVLTSLADEVSSARATEL